MFDLGGKVAIVTGSGSERGIGRATAVALAEQGATVIVTDINAEGIQNTVSIIQNAGGKANGITLDVTDQASVDSMVKEVMDTYGHIDILVNNAGISQRLSVADMKVEDMKRLFEINVFGLFRCTKAVLDIMKAQKKGRIINLSSVAGKRGGGVFGGAHYSATKAAVLGFSKNLAREVSRDGITVNCVAPGLTNTDIWASLTEDVTTALIKDIPVGRPGETREIAAAIAFLASDEAAYITGEEIDINGGSHMD